MDVPPCPDWCELPAGHPCRRVDGVLVREHRAQLTMPEHQQWPADWASVYAEERDGHTDEPRGRIRCPCTRPDPRPDGSHAYWKRRPMLANPSLLTDLCDD